MVFELDARIARTSAPVVSLTVCLVRLQLDARFPWLVLIPQRPAMRELEDLPDGEAALVLQETLLAGRVIRVMAADRWPVIEKLNMAAIGNVAPQLHLHVVGRWRDDAEWPHPVWGRGLAQPYSKALQTEIVTRARAAFAAVEPIVAAPYPAPPPGGHSEAIL